MPEDKWHTVTTELVVKPVKEPIFSEMATRIRLEDEASGCFVILEQPEGNIHRKGVAISDAEWPLIQQAVHTMLAIGEEIDRGTGCVPRKPVKVEETGEYQPSESAKP